MDNETIYKQLIADFGLENLKGEDQEELLLSLAKSVNKQFLMDTYAILGNEQFAALEASVDMGDEFYETTLKHLLPNHDEVFQEARKKVIDAYKKAAV